MSELKGTSGAEGTGRLSILAPPGERAHRLTLADACGPEGAALHVTVEGPDLEELDATALPPRSTLVLRHCPRLSGLRLGPIASANLSIARPAIEDSPGALHIHGSVESLDLRFGDRHLPAAVLPLGREKLDGAYIGPAALDIPDAPIRVCFGAGALEAVAQGNSARMRIALADPEGTHLHVSVWRNSLRHVRVVDCPRVESIDIGPGADDLQVERCPRLRSVDGEGRRARVVDGGTEATTLHAFGAWGRLAVVRCGYGRIECATSQVFLGRDAHARARPTIASLSGTCVAARDPDGPDGARDGPMLSGVGDRVPAAPGLLASLLRYALHGDADGRRRALRILARGDALALKLLPLLVQAMREGASLERVFAVRDVLADPSTARRRAAEPQAAHRAGAGVTPGATHSAHTGAQGPDAGGANGVPPAPHETTRLSWSWTTANDAHGEWLHVLDLELLEERRRHASTTGHEALVRAIDDAVTCGTDSWRNRCLARARVRWIEQARPHDWLDAVLAARFEAALATLEEQRAAEEEMRAQGWPIQRDRILNGDFRSHGPAILDALVESMDADGTAPLLIGLLRWTAASGTSRPGIDLLAHASAGGRADAPLPEEARTLARTLLAEAATKAPPWHDQDAPYALKALLGSVEPAR
jgi:hypothetical protein